jgi:hypothetical protein
MWVTEYKTISEYDYNKYKDAPHKDVQEFVGWAAHFSDYPPAGYGFRNPRIEKGERKFLFYAVWEHRDNCD